LETGDFTTIREVLEEEIHEQNPHMIYKYQSGRNTQKRGRETHSIHSRYKAGELRPQIV
jgi:hypothetical protein